MLFDGYFHIQSDKIVQTQSPFLFIYSLGAYMLKAIQMKMNEKISTIKIMNMINK